MRENNQRNLIRFFLEDLFWHQASVCHADSLYINVPLTRIVAAAKKKSVDDFFFVCLLLQIQYLILPKQVNRRDFIKNCSSKENSTSGAPNENIVQNHLNIALLNVF